MLHNPHYAATIRNFSDRARKKVRIASPYLGSWRAVCSVLGMRWWPASTSLYLLTDFEELSGMGRRTLDFFLTRNSRCVRSLKGLHSKLFLFDEAGVCGSANLTASAFERRYETGIVLSAQELTEAIKLFDCWWEQAFELNEEQLEKIRVSQNPNDENDGEGETLTKRWSLPDLPESAKGSSNGKFSTYLRFVRNYKEFAKLYRECGRVWPVWPLYLETDTFLNYLYHDAPGTPSHAFADTKKKAACFTRAQQQAEIALKFSEFRLWAADFGERESWRYETALRLKGLLSEQSLKLFTREQVREVASSLHCMGAYPPNLSRFLKDKNNTVPKIVEAWTALLHDDAPEVERMTKCDRELRFFGKSSIQELIGWYYPDDYPIRNSNSDSGLKLFGYDS